MSVVVGEDRKLVDASTQTIEKRKGHLLSNEFPQNPTISGNSRFVTTNEIQEISSVKKDRKSGLIQKRNIQNLIDFRSPRIGLKQIPTNHFSKNSFISKEFQLITLDKEPIPELMVCKKCKQVRARGRFTSSLLVRHLKQHAQVECSHRFDKKKGSFRTKIPLLDLNNYNMTMRESPLLSESSLEHKYSNQPGNSHGHISYNYLDDAD